MANTPNYGWETPDDTDYVYQGAAAARTTANAIDSTMYTTNTTLNNIGQGQKCNALNNSSLIVTTTTETLFFTASSAFTPVSGRLYAITITIGVLTKLTTAGTMFVFLRKNNASGTLLDGSYMSNVAVFEDRPFSKTFVLSSAQMGTSSFTPAVTVAATSGGLFAENSSPYNGTILVEDLGVF
jgi:hypothetical protein